MSLAAMLKKLFLKFAYDENGLAAVEAALVFPIMLVLLLGVFDMGNGILANQKTIRASQITADLIARQRTVNTGEINEAVEAGRLALEPLVTTSYGTDIVSIRFDDEADPVIVWRQTQNMSPLNDVLERVVPLAEPGVGVLVVATQYDFEPIFAGFVVDEIEMQEVAFARGRKTPVIEME
jgi:Flp pilus assembly protein TadG